MTTKIRNDDNAETAENAEENPLRELCGLCVDRRNLDTLFHRQGKQLIAVHDEQLLCVQRTGVP